MTEIVLLNINISIRFIEFSEGSSGRFVLTLTRRAVARGTGTRPAGHRAARPYP